jgi:Ni/Co efflux regulator RcnB
MKWFRTIRGFVRLLVALFMVAQFAGVVSSPRANAQPVANAMTVHDHHQHGHDHADKGKSHHHDDGSGNLADTCCALHAYFNGVLPAAIGIETGNVNGESLAVDPDDQGFGVPPGRLDRPPRPLC